MSILIRQARIIDPSSPFHRQPADILIIKGCIESIAPKLPAEADKIIEAKGMNVSPGWVDPFAHFTDPGEEFRETLETGSAAAAAGGFTDVFLLPNTTPALHNKSGIEYVVQKSKHYPVRLHPVGAVTRNSEGKELAEMYDMHASGAIAFSDGLNPVQSSGLLLKALQYLKAIGCPLIQLPDDRAIAPGGLMNEGVVSTRLGLPGRPAIAEELMVARDIELLRYTGSRLHFTGLTTAASLERVRKAKAEGLNVTCSVTPYHLFFCDEDLHTYNTNLKVNPPLRTPADREAVKAAVTDGTVDCIATHHIPQDNDHKLVEFEYARDGMIGLQTAFAAVHTALPGLSADQLATLLATNVRRIFGLPQSLVRKGEKAALTLFSLEEKMTFDKGQNRSKSGNSAFFGQNLSGKVAGIIQGEQVFLNQ